jgi:hypothetical protein
MLMHQNHCAHSFLSLIQLLGFLAEDLMKVIQ